MKKKILLILLFMMFIPFIAEAKIKTQYCTVASGNGKDVGSEIVCGSEHFYIVENKDDDVRMIGKYNLYVGANIDKVKLDINKTYIRYELCNSGESDCGCVHRGGNVFNFRCSNNTYFYEGEQTSGYSEWASLIEEKYNITNLNSASQNGYSKEEVSATYTENGKSYKKGAYKLYPITYITENTEGYALQNKKALGVTGEKGNANYPLYAVLNMFTDTEGNETKDYDNFANGYLNFEFKDNALVKGYLEAYRYNLIDMGYLASAVDMLNMKELNDLVYAINKKNLPLSEWYNASLESEPTNEDGKNYYNLGDLTEYLSNDYKWVWNTSYWTKTFAGNSISLDNDGIPNEGGMVYMISTAGDICYTYSECVGVPRAGIRPVVTLAKQYIIYNIYTKTDGNGTIEVVNNAKGGESISFKAQAKDGYKLVGITVTTTAGEKVEFSEEEIEDNGEVLSVSLNKFTMPFENVTIEAKWALAVNPNTKSSGYIILVSVVFLVSLFTFIVVTRKPKTVKN